VTQRGGDRTLSICMLCPLSPRGLSGQFINTVAGKESTEGLGFKQGTVERKLGVYLRSLPPELRQVMEVG
jgi:hypothetical protein